ncbi:type III secretion system chaperone [Ramlibacter sp. AN1015]|uniref:type III secretion system chaperone n=1 Tax=Ramlibacter sp. AN1015 TaxID=3133428 RepID=UPI0030BB3603
MQSPDRQDTRALVSLWLRRLGDVAGLSLQLSSEGVCGVGHESGMDCAIEVPEDGGAVYLRAPMLPWPPVHLARIAEHLLTEQFLGLGTDGATFAIDPRDRELVLWKCAPVALLDETSFQQLLMEFIQMAVHWRDELQRIDFAPDPSSDIRSAGEDAFEGADSKLRLA